LFKFLAGIDQFPGFVTKNGARLIDQQTATLQLRQRSDIRAAEVDVQCPCPAKVVPERLERPGLARAPGGNKRPEHAVGVRVFLFEQVKQVAEIAHVESPLEAAAGIELRHHAPPRKSSRFRLIQS
jgi:hypothetical protein